MPVNYEGGYYLVGPWERPRSMGPGIKFQGVLRDANRGEVAQFEANSPAEVEAQAQAKVDDLLGSHSEGVRSRERWTVF